MADREGPTVAVYVNILPSCGGCRHHSSASWDSYSNGEYDSGHLNYCALLHPDERRDIGERTPNECPFLAAAAGAAVAARLEADRG